MEATAGAARPDVAAAQAEHEALCALLEEAGAEVVVSEHDPGNPDAIYTYDPTLVGRDGRRAAAAGEGGPARRARGDRRDARGSRASRSPRGCELPATVEGGDTRLARRARRCSSGSATARTRPRSRPSRAAFPGVEVIAFDLPHWNGAGEVMHLMSFISPLDRDLALVYPRIAPTRLCGSSPSAGSTVVEVPDEEFESMGAERARARPAPRARARGERRDAPAHGARRGRRRHLSRRRDLAQGRRRPDLPDAPAAAALRR